MKNEKLKSKIKKNFLFFIVGSIFLFPPIISQAAIAITPPDHFAGDGTLSGGTASLIKINIIDEESGTYYLKAYFYPPSKTSARFGYVWNSTTNLWISTYQENSKQIQIEIAPNKQWSGEISVKTDIEKSGYLGSGDYVLRVRATPVATGHAIEISTNTSIVESNVIEPSPISDNAPEASSSQAAKPSPLPTSTSETTEGRPLSTKEVIYPKNIFINEILPAPEGADEQNEWLEIYNGNDFAVDLAGWQIKDQVGAIKTYAWPANSPLKARGFLTVSRAQSKIVLQNNGDGLTLVNPQGIIADQITYPTAPANQSYNRTSNGWVWSRILTPGQPNEIDKINTAVQQKIAQKKPAAVSATSATSSNSLAALPLMAQINQFSPSTNKLSRIFTFLLGLAIAAASAIVVVFLRKKQKDVIKNRPASR